MLRIAARSHSNFLLLCVGVACQYCISHNSIFPRKRSHSNFLLLCVGVACRRHIADLHLFLNAIAHPHLFPLGDNATHRCAIAGF
ncbi:hypothetical protein ACE1CI_33425 [Aerosakkonemataceae cyanobacterium BLCC-F50]|uniref:Secreted protein n=1 Tax=Floridaenema flaviceps BLCC-F50 TaxID=3153642 RepID=A0ABV4Y1L7_9CYAN